MQKYVYLFSEGNAQMRNTLGGKGANLAEMTNLGLPVPQGFTISTEACTSYYENGKQIAPEIMAQIEGSPRQDREDQRKEVRRRGEPAARLGALRRAARRCPA